MGLNLTLQFKAIVNKTVIRLNITNLLNDTTDYKLHTNKLLACSRHSVNILFKGINQ